MPHFLKNDVAEDWALTTPCGEFGVFELLAEAKRIAGLVRDQSIQRVAIRSNDTFSLLAGLIGLDSAVTAVMLLPDQLDSASAEALLAEAQIDAELDVTMKSCAFERADFDSDGFCRVDGSIETVWVLCTSGTTAAPKAVFHTMNSLTANIRRRTGQGAGYRWGLVYSPTKFAGLQVVLHALLAGRGLVDCSSLMDVEKQAALMLKAGVDALSGTPGFWRKWLMNPEARALELKQITLGGEIVDQRLLDSLARVYPTARLTHIYASTEVGVGFSVSDGQAGFPSSWVDTKDAPVQMRISKDNTLLLRPKLPTKGQHIDSLLDSEGYIDSGDVVELLGSRVFFKGRANGTINVGGNKIFPEVVERLIRNVTGVHDARVYGRSSGLMGEVLCADVVINEMAEWPKVKDAIVDRCRNALPEWQRPALVKRVQSIQLTRYGKVSRP